MKPNWTRCSARTSVLAPTSTIVTGCPGTGTGMASAGRWMPEARLMLNSAAASAGPVEPPLTKASASPAATARVARTIDASGFARLARTGSGALAMETGASTTSIPSATSPNCSAGPKSTTRTPCWAASAAPAATSAGPRSAPLASTATVMGMPCRLPSGAGWSSARGRDRGRARARPRARRRSRTSGRRDAAGAGCGTSGTRCRSAPRSCAGRGAWTCGECDCFCLGTAMGDRERG